MSVLASLLAQQRVNPDLIEIAVAVIIAIIAGIAKLMAALRQKQAPPDEAPQPPQPARPVPADVADEIDEFLRRAQQRRGAKSTQPAGVEKPSRPRRMAPDVTSGEKPMRAETVPPDRPVGGEVTEHVRKYLDAQDFTRRAGQLGEEVAQADQQVDQHLHQVFDHSVSHLAAATGEAARVPMAAESLGVFETTPEEVSPFGDSLLDVFSDPDSIRQAIVLNEIIRRPEERWG